MFEPFEVELVADFVLILPLARTRISKTCKKHVKNAFETPFMKIILQCNTQFQLLNVWKSFPHILITRKKQNN